MGYSEEPDPQGYFFGGGVRFCILHDDLFSESKKSLLRNTKSDKLYILGVRWIARLAFVRCVNKHMCAIAHLLLKGLQVNHATYDTISYDTYALLRGFIKGWALGKLTGCKDSLICLAAFSISATINF